METLSWRGRGVAPSDDRRAREPARREAREAYAGPDTRLATGMRCVNMWLMVMRFHSPAYLIDVNEREQESSISA